MPPLPRIPLAELLERDRNNLDLVRLISACLVIFGHAFVIVADPAYPPGTWDPSRFLHYEGIYSASIAVKIFFFISGLLVTNSLLTRRSVTHYLIGRFFRLWPALVVVVAVAAWLVGPLYTTFSSTDYWARPEVHRYVAGNLLMLMPGHLPGVFSDNPLPRLVNGALWSLSYEVGAYVALLGLGLLGIFRRHWLCVILALAVIVDPLLPHPLLFGWLGANPQVAYLPPCFALGALLAVLKDRVTLGPLILIVSAAAFLALKGTVAGPLAFLISLFLVLLYFSGLRWVCRLRLPFDPSYGTFLWGFLIQQILAAHFAERGLVFNLVTALVASLAAGWLSWHLIERPALRFGARLSKRLQPDATSSAESRAPVGQLAF